MTIKYERQYGVATTVVFPLFETDGVDLRTDAPVAAADTIIMKDEGTPAATASTFVDEGTIYSLALSAAEMTAARITVNVVDVTGTKVYLDEVLIIETEGNENAQHNRRQPGVILATTIASITDNSNFVITDKPNDNNTLLNSVAFILDNSSPDTPPDRSFRNVTSYTGSSGAVVLASDTDFTIAAGDLVWFLLTADVASAVEIAREVLPQKNTALADIPFVMFDSTDHVTPKTGMTITAERSIDGGTTFVAATGTAAEAENGLYHFDASAADMNGDFITLKFTGTDADPTFISLRTSA